MQSWQTAMIRAVRYGDMYSKDDRKMAVDRFPVSVGQTWEVLAVCCNTQSKVWKKKKKLPETHQQRILKMRKKEKYSRYLDVVQKSDTDPTDQKWSFVGSPQTSHGCMQAFCRNNNFQQFFKKPKIS